MAHIPVLLNEVLEILEPSAPLRQGFEGQGKVLVDGTAGTGGHAIPIIEGLTPDSVFVGIDWDEAMVTKLKSEIDKRKPKVRIITKVGNYADLLEILKEEKLGKTDGVILDLGFSSEQLERGKGFSFMKDEPLIMTYSKERPPVHQVLKRLNQKEIEEVIRNYSDERYAKRIAKAIWERERVEPITRSGELQTVIRQAVPKSYERGRINPATRTFMAFRIYVNDELGNLEKFLKSIPQVMAVKGRVAIISFHSLEDRMVKNQFRRLAKENRARLLTKKPITPNEAERKVNPRSRGAKLRAIEII